MKTNSSYKGKNLYDLAVKHEYDDHLIEGLIKVFSYFISNYNNDYIYNETYLPSYVNDFIKVKHSILDKKKKIDTIIEELKKKLVDNYIWNHIIIEFDKFWLYEENHFNYIFESDTLQNLHKEEISIKCSFEMDNTKKQVVFFYGLNKEDNIVNEIYEFIISLTDTKEISINGIRKNTAI